MESVILSICIPTYKRLRILETNLINVANCCEGFYEYVEVIVSDNDNLRSSNEVVKRINSTYPDFQIRYFSNSENFGHAFNYYEAVRNSSGVFTWLLGDDDFINLESVAVILNTIHLHKDVDFIFFKNKEMNYEDYISRKDSQLQLSNLNTLSEYNKIGFLKDFILPKYDNVFFGKMMISVFRTEVWKKTLLTSSELFGFNSLTSTYPHSYIYSKQFLNKETLYLESTLITTMEDTRTWGDNKSNNHWDTDETFIHFRILDDMIEQYRNDGLGLKNYLLSKNHNSKYVGELYFAILIRIYFQKGEIKNLELLDINRIIKSNIIFPGLYIGIIKSILKLILGINKLI